MIESEFLPRLDMSETEKREKYGCVMRTLESFFGAKATDAEWEERIDDVVKKFIELDKFCDQANPDKVYSFQKESLEKDFEDVRKFVRELSDHATPLGQMASKTPLRYSLKEASEVLNTLRSGKDIMIMFGLRVDDSRFKYMGHMAHLMYFPNQGTILSLSDGYSLLPIYAGRIYRVFERL